MNFNLFRGKAFLSPRRGVKTWNQIKNQLECDSPLGDSEAGVFLLVVGVGLMTLQRGLQFINK